MSPYIPRPLVEDLEELLAGDAVGLLVGETSIVTRPDTLIIPIPDDCFKKLRKLPLSTAVLNLERMTLLE